MRTLYRHIKSGNVYEVLGFAWRESDLAEMVVYREAGLSPLPRHVWTRPVAEFATRFEDVKGQGDNHSLLFEAGPPPRPKERCKTCNAIVGGLPGIVAGPTEYTTQTCPECLRRENRAKEAAEANRVPLFCPYCAARHVDAGEWATRPHHKHLCHACGKLFRIEPFAYGAAPGETVPGATAKVLATLMPTPAWQEAAIALTEAEARAISNFLQISHHDVLSPEHCVKCQIQAKAFALIPKLERALDKQQPLPFAIEPAP